MNVGLSFLRSKVARRIFILFILCAMFPVFTLSVLSYYQVSGQLKNQTLERLHNSVKSHGMSIYERILFSETTLQLITSEITEKNQVLLHNEGFSKTVTERFSSLVILGKNSTVDVLYGDYQPFSDPFIQKAYHSGYIKTRILFEQKDEGETPVRVFMLMRLMPDINSDILIGEIDHSYLWGIGYENILPPMTGLCVIDQVRNILITSFPVDREILHNIAMKNDGKSPRSFTYDYENSHYFISYWPMFLKSRFDSPNLNIILRSDSAEALAPLFKFKVTFSLVILLSLWVVLLLSIMHIRKNLDPLVKLKEGTRRVARQIFNKQVSVTSNDEFQDLADSFNTMSKQLDREFNALNTSMEIDKAIISSLSTKKIIHTALMKMFQFFSCSSIGINIILDRQPDTFHSLISTDISIRKPVEDFYKIDQEDKKYVDNNPGYFFIDTSTRASSVLSEILNKTGDVYLILPLFYNKSLRGTIALGHVKHNSFSENDLKHARQIADQVTIALSHSSLVEKLEKLNFGTLEALARAVDAKSAWTAGHSERVTELALKIAKVMGYSQSELDSLQRAAYLHDIGKIGVPISILDKPDKLTDSEFSKIKDHPSIGLRILEPIEAFEDILPIVEQHHEKYNGKGYPGGLSGENISLGARILAVADVYDAVVSDRPYRNGWIEDKAIKMITSESGSHFDPKVVEAFLAVI